MSNTPSPVEPGPNNTRVQFVREREHHVSLLGLTLVFSATMLCMWLFSALLLWGGMTSMSVRYLCSAGLAYVSFFVWMRLWIEEQIPAPKPKNENTGWDGSGGDAIFAHEGCMIVVLIFVFGFVVSVMVSVLGGIPLLLEVAFEAAFAGTLVGRINRRDWTSGHWYFALLKHTWLPTLLAAVLAFGVGAMLEKKAPEAVKFSEAWRVILRR
jgi:hypothetical protein